MTRLIVGLGNPGAKYDNTRHNLGFMVLDYYAKVNNIDFKLKASFKGLLGVLKTKEDKIFFLQPHTYMNLSGISVSATMKYYNITSDNLVVICDDLSLPTGKVRIRASGSSGGHKGLESINNVLGTTDYKRIRIGIDQSPVIPTTDYVLGKFTTDEQIILKDSIEKCTLIIDEFIKGVDFQKIISTRN